MRWCVHTKEIQDAERSALEQGVSQEELIRKVARGIHKHPVFLALLERKGPILLLVGRGLNGLDCLALGCELLKEKKQVVAHELSHRTPNPLSSLIIDEFVRLGGEFISLDQVSSLSFAMVIDGLLGTGAKKVRDQELHGLISRANKIVAPLVSIDLPSGVSPETGEIWDEAIEADYTFVCQAPKKGIFFQRAWEKVGALYVIDLGLSIPSSDMSWIEVEDVLNIVPSLERMTHKYRRGTVHVLAGSRGMMGAHALAARAAFAAGAGYVHSYVPETCVEESIMVPIEAVRTFYNPKRRLKHTPDRGALIVGPGLGQEKYVRDLIEEVLQNTNVPLVLDGDGLNCLPKEFLASSKLERAVLTPHRKEAERLFGGSFQELSQVTIDRLREIAQKSCACIILKGAPTVIASPNGEIEIMGFGTPALATAGSGDVLSGIVGALLAQNLSRLHACRLGTVIHALCGLEAARTRTSYSVQAEHILEAISEIYYKLLSYSHVTFQTYRPSRLN